MTYRILAFLGAMSLALVGAAGATEQSMPKATEYLRHLPPTITGTIVSSTQHSMVLNSTDGDQVTFDMDSRTVVPTDLTEGRRMRVEFHTMESGRYLAKRVTPIDPNETVVGQVMTSMRTDLGGPRAGDEDADLAESADHDQANPPAYQNTSTTSSVSPGGNDRDESSTQSSNPSTEKAEEAKESASKSETLPATATNRPLVGALGALALVMGAGLWLSRRGSV